MGDKKQIAVTDPQGIYTFADLPDGVWNLQVEMLCFTPLKNEVAIAPNSPSPEWELKLLPFDEIKASAPPPAPNASPLPATSSTSTPQTGVQVASATPAPADKAAAPPKKGSKAAAAAAATAAANARPGFQRADLNASNAPPPAEPAAGGIDEAAPGANDALLVNGSVSNGVERRAIGNFRKGPGSGYRGDLSSILTTRCQCAQLLLHGSDTPRAPYNHIRFGARSADRSHPAPVPPTTGIFLVGYQGAATATPARPGLVPTEAERVQPPAGFRPTGQPLPVIDPDTGAPFPSNVIPVTRISPQAKALLNLYPLPNFNSLSNLQLPDSAGGHGRLDGYDAHQQDDQPAQLVNGSLGWHQCRESKPLRFVDGNRTGNQSQCELAAHSTRR
jgi:hypothetical protein